MKRYFLGIDIGTTDLKSVLTDEEGQVAAEGREHYGFLSPAPGQAEQEAEVFYEKTCAAVRKMTASLPGTEREEIAGISFSGQAHGVVFLDGAGKPLRPAILWPDRRSSAETAEIRRNRMETFSRICLNAPATGYGALSWLWLRKNEPEIARATRMILGIKDYVRFRLCGEPGADFSDFSTTCFLDVRRRRTDPDFLNELHVSEDCLPPLRESADRAGSLRRAPAEAMGLKAGIPIFFGGTDSCMQALGAGVCSEDRILLTVGTAAQVSVAVPEPIFDPRFRTNTFCHVLPRYWYLYGALLNGGLVMSWLKGLSPGLSPEEREDRALSVPPGAEGLVFLPYLQGERSPHTDSKARGIFWGLTLRHELPHLLRAALEGVGYALYENYLLLLSLLKGRNRKKKNSGSPRIFMSGGGGRSRLWPQMLASLIGEEIAVLPGAENGAAGAALTAGVGCEHYKDYAEAGAAVRKKGSGREATIIAPEDTGVSFYKENFEIYRKLYAANAQLRHRD